jgi:methylaspartate mutase epsilon subunit
MKETYRLLIGSIGDDSHSVGSSLLTIAFKEIGFWVKNLGILNSLDDFFTQANNYDAILISCNNGHTDLYLTDFERKKHVFELGYNSPIVWCLGGNLSVQEDEYTVIKRYRKMGFDYVSPKPVSWEIVYQNLLKEFSRKEIQKKKVYGQPHENFLEIPGLDHINDLPISDELFTGLRNEVLASWHTGNKVFSTNIIRNHSNPHKNFHSTILANQKNGAKPLVQPRTGVAHVKDQIELLQYLRKHGLDISSIQLDAASRKKMFKQAEEGVCRTNQGGKSFLNGYPVPVHGIDGIERIVQSIDTPFQIRAGSPDHRLVYEIGLAGGVSGLEGGFICYLYPYDKHTSPVESLNYWKYIDKLSSWYEKNYRVIINREYFGPLTCCLIEPTIPICINIVQSLLSAISGVKSISVGLAEQGNRAQDIAAIRVLKNLTRLYLDKYGYKDRSISTVFHEYMAAFPKDFDKARNLILQSSVTGTLARADRIMTKTHVESVRIPAKEDNAEGLTLTHQGIEHAKDIHFDTKKVMHEEQLLTGQVKNIMNWIELHGQGSIARGAIKAFVKGVLDIQFSPNAYNRNHLISARDADGAIRYINPENLPFPEDTINFHKEKMHNRMMLERTNKVAEILEKDLTRIWKNDFKKWPLDEAYMD